MYEETVNVSKEEVTQGKTCDNTEERFLSKVIKGIQTLGVAGYTDAINADLKKWMERKLNIAVIGPSGTGKSSFINAIRGLRFGDEGFAEIGCNETTTRRTSYPYPKHPNLILWDLPGVGTEDVPKETYLNDVKIETYDFFILVTATRFTTNDAWLGNKILCLGKKFYFVRSKIDFDVQNEFELKGTSEQATLVDIRNRTIKSLSDTGLKNQEVFLVNNKDIQEYDFNDLIAKLINDAEGLLKETLVLSMASLTKNILEEKRKILEKRIFKMAVLSAAAAAIPIPGTGIVADVVIMMNETRNYKEQFGTDDRSLKVIATKLGIPVEDLVTKYDVKSTQILKWAAAFGSFIAGCAMDSLFEESLKMIPIFGSLFACATAFPMSKLVQGHLLQICYDEAVRVLDVQKQSTLKVKGMVQTNQVCF